jgi:Holliday junction resolvase RusA-like endonuclease
VKRIRLFIPIEPMQRSDPKPVTMWYHGKQVTRLFQTTEYTDWKRRMAEVATLIINRDEKLKAILPLECPIIVGFTFYISRQEIVGFKKKRGVLINPGKEIFHAAKHHTQKPDLSNFEKAAEDSLTGTIWKDDCLIVGHDPAPYKFWADNGQVPGIEIVIAPYGMSDFPAIQAEMVLTPPSAE